MKLLIAAIAFCTICLTAAFVHSPKGENPEVQSEKPNIVVIMADDMGFSDIGCYGGEIPTPNIDELASRGVRLSQFYNNGRCCPTRASLLTGLHPHHAGIGRMSEDPENTKAHDEGVDGYRGYLSKNTVTIPEVLKTAGYKTYMAGKWHVGMHGQEKWPLQRGFDRFYGILGGGSSYLRPFPPRGITTNNGEMQYDFPDDYYTTDAFTTNAVRFIEEHKESKPFFLYLAYTAPHWPLHAKEEDIKLFTEHYKAGWDSIGRERLRKQLAMGVTKSEWGIAQREMRPWDQLTTKEKEDVSYRMAVYAAQVYRMDQNIGKVIRTLKEQKKFDNTLIVFLSDNGACAEPYQELGGKDQQEINDPSKFWVVSYGSGWANTSNIPFKKWKNQAYEGGLATPFIACWPNGIRSKVGKWSDTPYHIIDLMETFAEVGGAKYPKNFKGNPILPTEGISMLPALKTGKGVTHEYFYWEHEENCAVRHGDWKGVKRLPDGTWELYNLKNDRTERNNLAEKQPEIVKDLDAKWQAWADTHKVFPKGSKYKGK